jgi:hypothetical protein
VRSSTAIIDREGTTMGYISGRHRTCADPRCDYKGPLTLDVERFIGSKRLTDVPLVVGEESCPSCGARMLFSRKLTKAEARTLHYDCEVLFQRVVEEVIEWPQ